MIYDGDYKHCAPNGAFFPTPSINDPSSFYFVKLKAAETAPLEFRTCTLTV